MLSAITLCGLALRLWEAASQPLWTDEALTLVLAKWPTLDLILRPVDPTAGLYYVLHQLFVPNGAGLAGIRGISIVAGTLSIPAIYAVARLGIGRPAGLIAAVLLAISPVPVDYSQEARAYALQLFLVLVSAGALLGWARQLGKQGGMGALALFVCATVLAFSTHLSGIFWVLPAVPLSAWATFRYGTVGQRRKFLIALAIMASGALPELIRLVWRADLGGGFVWLAQANLSDGLATWTETLLPTDRLLGDLVAHLLVLAIFVLLAWRLYVHRSSLRAWIIENSCRVGRPRHPFVCTGLRLAVRLRRRADLHAANDPHGHHRVHPADLSCRPVRKRELRSSCGCPGLWRRTDFVRDRSGEGRLAWCYSRSHQICATWRCHSSLRVMEISSLSSCYPTDRGCAQHRLARLADDPLR